MPFDSTDTAPIEAGATVTVSNGRGLMFSTVVARLSTEERDTEATRYKLEGPSGNEYIRRRRSIDLAD